MANNDAQQPEKTPRLNMYTLPLAMGLYAQAVAGQDSTFLDKAVFVAMPFVIEASAVTGAEAGARAWAQSQGRPGEVASPES